MGEKGPDPKRTMVVVIIIALALSNALFIWVKYYATDTDENVNQARYKELDGDFHIKLTHFRSKDISDTGFYIVDLYGGTLRTWEGKDLRGNIRDITAMDHTKNESFYENASDTDPLNYTDRGAFYYYIAFVDANDNGFIDSGDRFFLKGKINEGVVYGSHTLRITSNETGRSLLDVSLRHR